LGVRKKTERLESGKKGKKSVNQHKAVQTVLMFEFHSCVLMESQIILLYSLYLKMIILACLWAVGRE
jgi:hypothetical protein